MYPVWITSAGSLGSFPSGQNISLQLVATPTSPATSVTFTLLSGTLPDGLALRPRGLIYGIPSLTGSLVTNTFVIRVTDNLGKVSDRTFSITISGVIRPTFVIGASPNIKTVDDSVWVEIPILYNNPVNTNPVTIRLVQGSLPPGLEINEAGLIRGYANPPTAQLNLESISTQAIATSSSDNTILITGNTKGFAVGRVVQFNGTIFGGVSTSIQYFVSSFTETTFSISTTAGGPIYLLTTASGAMDVTLPSVTQEQPTVRTYSFTLELISPNGNDLATFSITVKNQNAPVSQGGPGKPLNSRIPTILNTRPATYQIEKNVENYGYYVLPPEGTVPVEGLTYPPVTNAYIGLFQNDDYFAFKCLGYDFDSLSLSYEFIGLPNFLTGDTNTGWVTGVTNIADNSIVEYNFQVRAYRGGYSTPYFNFSFQVTAGVDNQINWITPRNLGTIFNGTLSTKYISAISENVDLQYRIVSGTLPPNLTLTDNGEITGVVSYQPTEDILSAGTSTDFIFTVEAYSTEYVVLKSTKTFVLTVYQEYDIPTDTLYIKCTPALESRTIINELLTNYDDNVDIIPNDWIYRPQDPYFGKATSIIYEHAYGIYASDFEEYVKAVTKNHYWRNITLGSLSTAVAKNEQGEIIYEVVYSNVIDNLINPEGISVSRAISWPRFINLNQGPWYTSITDLYTSYVYYVDLYLYTQFSIPILTQSDIPLIVNRKSFYTSLTPGYAKTLYPNSLPNMRWRVGYELGQEFDFRLLPLWMTSQQKNGSTLGYTPAWVICYVKPGFVKDTKGNFIKNSDGSNRTYAEQIVENIKTMWVDILGNPHTLNEINFTIDRFTVDKRQTYNYDTKLFEYNNPTQREPAWIGLPSADPPPNPSDSEDFYVLFPRKTILPDNIEFQ